MGCHKMHDLCIDMSKDERDERELRYIEEMQARARRDGWDLAVLKKKPKTKVLEKL
jgi:hypothetical protein